MNNITVTNLDIDSSYDNPLVTATITTPRGSLEVGEWLSEDRDGVERRSAESHVWHTQRDDVVALLAMPATDALTQVWDALDAALAD